ncbi:polysaccharide deacetylase family protein [Streptomyces sp. NRRL F-5065]|uniref:polysaccharide deacetylase family protein n=1 Tax=Streptomyces sp. NRRL F-5065 TaxID=1463855 RepID=UPI0004BF2A07|nr:polysaccharide deacetylase family protein [Streptomyces sp. NRRL F-5065]
MRRGRFRTAGAAPTAALAALLLAGCAPSPGPAPDAAAGKPAARAEVPDAALPPVVDRVPTTDRVVFLTYDDGAERDPGFADVIRAHRLPVTLFLTENVAGPAYGRFARLRSVGASLQNHTLEHRSLRGLPYVGQRAEICGQRRKLDSRFGVRPHLLRPPHGTYDTTTLRAAADCGVTALVLWRATAGAGGDLVFTGGEQRLRPGDIIAVDPDEPAGPPPGETTLRLLRTIGEQGLAVGRLEDYL